ncbi:hypothetical protein ACFWOG_39555 [Kitasatospora sp. NPDC058406]|uniref:hypothetical protein n=1 Tax=Kitasatospora sp. NPDC058406 TaxID=3346483 RepID=UPI00364AB23F
MSERAYLAVSINNRTKVVLKVQNYELEAGTWKGVGDFPPVDVPPGGNGPAAFHCSAKEGTASGIEGYVIYQMGEDPSTTIKITWWLLWGGSNDIKIEPSDPDISVSMKGWVGHGASESPVLTVHDERG